MTEFFRSPVYIQMVLSTCVQSILGAFLMKFAKINFWRPQTYTLFLLIMPFFERAPECYATRDILSLVLKCKSFMSSLREKIENGTTQVGLGEMGRLKSTFSVFLRDHAPLEDTHLPPYESDLKFFFAICISEVGVINIHTI